MTTNTGNKYQFTPPFGSDPFANAVVDLVSPVSIAEGIQQEEEDAWEKAKEDRIAEHMATCGHFFYRPDPSNGRRLVAYEVACGYWRRGCQRCLQIRAREFENRFHRCIKQAGDEYLGVAQMSKKEAAKIVKRMKSAGTQYWRIPVPEGIILIFDSLHFPDLNNPDLHDSLDWVELCQTPVGTRYSGDLGREEKEEKTGMVVKVPQFTIINLPNVNIDHAWSLALKNTAGLNPKYDAEEIEEALQDRMDEFEDAIVSMGGEVGEKYRIMCRVKEETFGWYKDLSPLDTKSPVDINQVPPGFVEESEIDVSEDIDLIFDY